MSDYKTALEFRRKLLKAQIANRQAEIRYAQAFVDMAELELSRLDASPENETVAVYDFFMSGCELDETARDVEVARSSAYWDREIKKGK